MKRLLAVCALGATGVLLQAAPASAAKCLEGGTTLDVREPLEGSYVVGVPLYSVNADCLDHLLP